MSTNNAHHNELPFAILTYFLWLAIHVMGLSPKSIRHNVSELDITSVQLYSWTDVKFEKNIIFYCLFKNPHHINFFYIFNVSTFNIFTLPLPFKRKEAFLKVLSKKVDFGR